MSEILRAPVRVAFAAAFTLGISAGSAFAQSTIAYASAGPALVQNIGIRDIAWQAGGGVEVGGGPATFGGGLDYVYFPAVAKTGPHGGSSSPPVSAIAPFVQASYHFGDSNVLRGFNDSQRLSPLVSGGFTFLTGGDNAIPMLHLAGGVDWWMTRKTALRVEVREQWSGMLSFRLGIAVR